MFVGEDTPAQHGHRLFGLSNTLSDLDLNGLRSRIGETQMLVVRLTVQPDGASICQRALKSWPLFQKKLPSMIWGLWSLKAQHNVRLVKPIVDCKPIG